MEMTDEERRYQIVKRTEYEEQVESKKKSINKTCVFGLLDLFSYLFVLCISFALYKKVSYSDYLKIILLPDFITSTLLVERFYKAKSLFEEKGKLIGKIELINEMLGISSDEYEKEQKEKEQKGKMRKLVKG